jgi:hypothetical protein
MGMKWLPDCPTRYSGEILYSTGRVRHSWPSDIGSRNCVEFVFAIVALVGHEAKVAQTALTGGILTNTLLILGTCFFMGGFQKHTQTYPAILARLKSTLLIIGVASLMLPTAHRLCAEGMPHCNLRLFSSSDVLFRSVYSGLWIDYIAQCIRGPPGAVRVIFVLLLPHPIRRRQRQV